MGLSEAQFIQMNNSAQALRVAEDSNEPLNVSKTHVEQGNKR